MVGAEVLCAMSRGIYWLSLCLDRLTVPPSLLGVKRPERERNWPPSCIEVHSEPNFISTPPLPKPCLRVMLSNLYSTTKGTFRQPVAPSSDRPRKFRGFRRYSVHRNLSAFFYVVLCLRSSDPPSKEFHCLSYQIHRKSLQQSKPRLNAKSERRTLHAYIAQTGWLELQFGLGKQ